MHIGDTLQKKKIEKDSGRDLNKRYELLEETAEMLRKPVEQVMSLTKGWSPEKIEERYLYVQKNGDNPAALWWHLYKQDT